MFSKHSKPAENEENSSSTTSIPGCSYESVPYTADSEMTEEVTEEVDLSDIFSEKLFEYLSINTVEDFDYFFLTEETGTEGNAEKASEEVTAEKVEDRPLSPGRKKVKSMFMEESSECPTAGTSDNFDFGPQSDESRPRKIPKMASRIETKQVCKEERRIKLLDSFNIGPFDYRKYGIPKKCQCCPHPEENRYPKIPAHVIGEAIKLEMRTYDIHSFWKKNPNNQKKLKNDPQDMFAAQEKTGSQNETEAEIGSIMDFIKKFDQDIDFEIFNLYYPNFAGIVQNTVEASEPVGISCIEKEKSGKLNDDVIALDDSDSDVGELPIGRRYFESKQEDTQFGGLNEDEVGSEGEIYEMVVDAKHEDIVVIEVEEIGDELMHMEVVDKAEKVEMFGDRVKSKEVRIIITEVEESRDDEINIEYKREEKIGNVKSEVEIVEVDDAYINEMQIEEIVDYVVVEAEDVSDDNEADCGKM